LNLYERKKQIVKLEHTLIAIALSFSCQFSFAAESPQREEKPYSPTPAQMAKAQKAFDSGITRYQQFNYKSASESFAQAIRLAPDWIDPYLRKAEVDVGRGQPEEAEQTALRAIEIKPDSAAAHYWLGYSRMSLHKYQEAITALRKATQIKPDFAQAYSELGAVYHLSNLNIEALTAYKRAIEINPQYALAHLGLCRLYIDLKDFSAALQEYQTLVKLEDSNAPMVRIELKRSARLEMAKEAVTKRPADPVAQFELGLATMDGDSWVIDDRFKRAKSFFEEAIRLKPDYPEAHFALGVSYVELLDKKSANLELDELKRLNPSLAKKLAQKIKKGPSQLGLRVMTPNR
jgi:tetratricopeptide (TPR) repeat protein